MRAMGSVSATQCVSGVLEQRSMPANSHATLRCRRKKDHGRAEAMLIAAWALGLRIEPETDNVIVVPAAESKESSEDVEDVLPLEEEVQEAAC